MSPYERECRRLREANYAAQERARQIEFSKPLSQVIREVLSDRPELGNPWDKRSPGPAEFDRWGNRLKTGLFR